MNRPALTATTVAWDAYARELETAAQQASALLLQALEHKTPWPTACGEALAALENREAEL